jgi:hypothetical protein
MLLRDALDAGGPHPEVIDVAGISDNRRSQRLGLVRPWWVCSLVTLPDPSTNAPS